MSRFSAEPTCVDRLLSWGTKNEKVDYITHSIDLAVALLHLPSPPDKRNKTNVHRPCTDIERVAVDSTAAHIGSRERSS